ncbi:MAG: glycosyltransferase [Patescibacteria group bacterium]|jgi:glycosyltransferase involved in cell wall biosynthesis
MKVAIFHNLEKGGALNYLIEISKCLNNRSISIDLFSFNNNAPKSYFSNVKIIKLKKSNNIFDHIRQIIFELPKKSKIISDIVRKQSYDFVLIFPCNLIQAPYLLNQLKDEKVFYIFTEPKREFYEKTSFDYYNIKKTLARTLRTYIKFIDRYNTRRSNNIFSISVYEQHLLKKYYSKNSIVIYPGLKRIKAKQINKEQNKKIITIGQLSYLKGHVFTSYQLKPSSNVSIIGRITLETQKITNVANKHKTNINIIKTENDNEKFKILEKYSIFLSNYIKEPFGIATLEASGSGLFILGKNEGGTPEIIQHGINGFLYPNNIKIAKKTLSNFLSKNILLFFKNNEIDWEKTTNDILKCTSDHIST